MKLYFKDKSNKFKAKFFKETLKSAFKKIKLNDKIEVGLILTDNLEIKRLNRKFRNIDSATDVLSFPIEPLSQKTNDYIMLGDIVISTEMAKKQNKKEINKLFKHGLLHLLGFDHERNYKEWDKAELKIVSAKGRSASG